MMDSQETYYGQGPVIVNLQIWTRFYCSLASQRKIPPHDGLSG